MSLLSCTWTRAQRILLRPGGHGVALLVSPRTPGWVVNEIHQRHALASLESVRDGGLDTLLVNTYSDTGNAAVVVDTTEGEVDLDHLVDNILGVTDLLDAQGGTPVVRIISAPLTQAVRDEASDIHIEPFETHSVVRYRVDGTLRDVIVPRKALHAALVSRIKVMVQLDITEKRLPQGGHIVLRVAGQPIDIHVLTVPTGHDERVVMCLLDKQTGRLRLEALDMAPDVLAPLDNLIRQSHGVVLITGPTGSGKTTTLYAALARLGASTSNILTTEDPVEYDLPGISQIQVNVRIDMTLAVALRAILRQDPDTVMIGEIRDLETTQITMQASLAGHLVLATLHTNDTVSAVIRLVGMGVEPLLLVSSMFGVLAQHLVRRLCAHCRVEEDGGWCTVSCPTCNQTGYSGHTGIRKLFVIDDEIRRLVHQGRAERDLRGAARAAGMRNIREDGERWIASGFTTLEKILRATQDA